MKEGGPCQLEGSQPGWAWGKAGCAVGVGSRLKCMQEATRHVNRAEGAAANEKRGLVCDVSMGQSQARRAEGDCNYEVGEKGSTPYKKSKLLCPLI